MDAVGVTSVRSKEEEVRATTKGALEMILKGYPPSTNRDSCLYFREMKVTFKYFFEAVVGQEQIKRLTAEYRMKGGRILCIPCGLWFGGVSFE